MFFKSKNRRFETLNHKMKKSAENMIPPAKETLIAEIKNRLHYGADLMVKEANPNTTLFYLDTLIEKTMLHQDIISQIQNNSLNTLDDIEEKLSVGDIQKMEKLDEAIKSALTGSVIIHIDGNPAVILAKISSSTSRSLSAPENESLVIGPQLAFNESLSTNISLIRRYLTDPNLCNESFNLGQRTNTSVSMLYIKDLASEQLVDNLRERITNIKIDGILDSSKLEQLIEDSSFSIFPQMVLTERPDRICSWLLNGKLAILVDGSSLAIACPQSFFEFFQSMEDENVRWQIGSFLRLLRMTALFISVFFTAVYVAALTFHYEVIPQNLLIPLSESRSKVPFPPIFEALLLEFMIELLREAGARLPTKVGQTMGIVGGIVIGTAAVDAGFTSNILIIIVALGALSSFATPSYTMGNIVRVIRFPLIILAGFWGFYGIMFGFCFLLLHLLRQKSLGSPFLAPFYPPRFINWMDSIIRMPPSFTFKRALHARPQDENKFDPDEAQKRK